MDIERRPFDQSGSGYLEGHSTQKWPCFSISYNRTVVEKRKRPKPIAPGRWLCYYDGNCGFCSGIVRGLSSLDVFGRVAWIPYQSLEEPPTGLSWEDLESAVYLERGQGRFYRGFYAFRMLSAGIPPLTLLLPLLWLPGVRFLGEALYARIARNRCHHFGGSLPETPEEPAERDG